MKASVQRVSITLAILLVSIILPITANAQLVKQAFGMNFSAHPSNVGGSYKVWLSPVFSLEGILFTKLTDPVSMQGAEASAFITRPIGMSRHLNWYAGGGFEIRRNTMEQEIQERRTVRTERVVSWNQSIMSRAGVEYKLPHFPIHLSVDAGPGIQVLPKTAFRFDAHLAIRYTIPNTRYTAANYVNRGRLPKGHSFTID